jgi:hypothetical protein
MTGDRPLKNSTADVRPIEEVVKDCRAALMKKLPATNRQTLAAWTAVNECARIISFADLVLTEEEDQPGSFDRRWVHIGEKQAASAIARRIADELKVPNMFSEMK